MTYSYLRDQLQAQRSVTSMESLYLFTVFTTVCVYVCQRDNKVIVDFLETWG